MAEVLNLQVSEQEYSTIKALADFRGESINALALDAIHRMLEDWEDARDAQAILARNEPTCSWEEVQRRAGLHV